MMTPDRLVANLLAVTVRVDQLMKAEISADGVAENCLVNAIGSLNTFFYLEETRHPVAGFNITTRRHRWAASCSNVGGEGSARRYIERIMALVLLISGTYRARPYWASCWVNVFLEGISRRSVDVRV